MQKKLPQIPLDKTKFLSRLFQITVALWFLRMVLPGVKYIFIPSLVVLFFASVFALKGNLFSKTYIFEFLKTFNPLLFLGVFFVLGLFLSDKLYERPLRDLFEYGVNLLFLVLFFALTYYSRKTEGFFWVFKKMTRVIWVTSVFVALIGLTKYLLQILGVEMPFDTPWGTSINTDKNFYALYSFLGLAGLYPRIAGSKTPKKRVIAFLLLLVLVTNIIFSYSPRSVLLLLILFIGLLVHQVFVLLGRGSYIKNTLATNLLPITILLAGFYSGVFWSVNHNQHGVNQWMNHYTGEQIDLNNLKSESFTDHIYQFEKWEFALEYYQRKPILAQLFGGGFDYLPVFGQKFHQDKTYPDYPHNPVLSALLYSGVLGAIFVVFFLLVSFYYSVLYFRKHPLFATMLFICSLFIFFSGNSLFSVPIFLFLFSLSFLVRHQEISELKIVPNLSKPGSKFIKEVFDYMLATVSIVILSPLLIAIVLIVGFTMGWPVVYTQTRIGQNGKPFKLHKFRSMKKVKSDTTIAASEKNRITWFGKFMRKYKLDELPELWNIIRGDMSFVGPRPDVPGYADELTGDDRIILQLKPGLTGAASLKYMHEEEILAKQNNPKQHNDEVIFPDKVLVNKKYMEKWSLWLDLKIIFLTAIGKSMHEDKFLF